MVPPPRAHPHQPGEVMARRGPGRDQTFYRARSEPQYQRGVRQQALIYLSFRQVPQICGNLPKLNSWSLTDRLFARCFFGQAAS